jgi:hypothetical protein
VAANTATLGNAQKGPPSSRQTPGTCTTTTAGAVTCPVACPSVGVRADRQNRVASLRSWDVSRSSRKALRCRPPA